MDKSEPLFYAVIKDDFEEVKQLLAEGADVNAKYNSSKPFFSLTLTFCFCFSFSFSLKK